MTIWFFVSILLAAAAFYAGLSFAHHRWHPSHEVSRKIVHIAHALVIIVLSVTTNYKAIIILELLFFTAVLVARYWKLFPWMRDVGRLSAGEYLYPFSVIALALLDPPVWIFVAAILNLGLADGLAAVIGTRYGKGNDYQVFGHKKSLAGSGAFLAVSFLITLWVLVIGAPDPPTNVWLVILCLPLLTTLFENFSPLGSDNVTVPFTTYAVLMLLF